MNGIAEKTDVNRLLMPGQILSEASLKAPAIGLFAGYEADCIALLG
jgi:hypothetical protein